MDSVFCYYFIYYFQHDEHRDFICVLEKLCVVSVYQRRVHTSPNTFVSFVRSFALNDNVMLEYSYVSCRLHLVRRCSPPPPRALSLSLRLIVSARRTVEINSCESMHSHNLKRSAHCTIVYASRNDTQPMRRAQDNDLGRERREEYRQTEIRA